MWKVLKEYVGATLEKRCWPTYSSNKDTIADDAERCGGLHYMVWHVPREFKHTSLACYNNHLHMCTLAFYTMRDRYHWSISTYLRMTKIFIDHHGLFYKVGRSRAVGLHHEVKIDFV